MDEKSYWLGFSCFSGIGPVKFNLLLNTFGSAKNAWNASSEDLKKVLGESLFSKFTKFKTEFSLPNYKKKLKEKNVTFLTIRDKEYPKLLLKGEKSPFVLYIKGDFDFLTLENSIGVVGTRKTTHYGREVTKSLTSDLVQSGFLIVSGLAMGVDAIAAQTALENNGKTIAVLGCGADICYPSINRNLYNAIIENGGAIVSEVPVGQTPGKGLFPARNRIIAGLSQGVLVTEGAYDSGALITADSAFKISRPVFAVPGPITSSLSKGPYKLIQKGAKLVTNSNDILKEFSKGPTLARVGPLKSKGDTKEEQKIIDLLQNEPLSFDQIVRKTKFDAAKTSGLISIMELKGFIKSTEPGKFTITR